MKKDSSHYQWFDPTDLLNQILIVLVGVVILFVNLGIMDPGILAYWPLVLVVIGLRSLMHSHR